MATTNRRPDTRESTVHTGSPGEQVLAHAQAGREIVQDFVPLAASLEWQLGQQYLRQRGNLLQKQQEVVALQARRH